MPNNKRWSRAVIAPTGYGGYGIWWAHNPEELNYSGPFDDADEAERKAFDIAEFHTDRRFTEVTHAEQCRCLRGGQPDQWHQNTCPFHVEPERTQ
jgi:hypothetical protein